MCLTSTYLENLEVIRGISSSLIASWQGIYVDLPGIMTPRLNLGGSFLALFYEVCLVFMLVHIKHSNVTVLLELLNENVRYSNRGTHIGIIVFLEIVN